MTYKNETNVNLGEKKNNPRPIGKKNILIKLALKENMVLFNFSFPLFKYIDFYVSSCI